ncbi:MAG: ribosomal-processing cysteine protease Prp [Eubacterium sp.]|nr:ribosomal-processing cysteine protease Prp [Eubacterium sp.]
MVKVTIYKNRNQELKGFCCTGHAGYAVHGEDIVCAGVSVLVLNTINSIERFTEEEYDLETEESSGRIRFLLKGVPSEAADLLLNSMILGLEGIRSSYGKKYVTLKFKEV